MMSLMGAVSCVSTSRKHLEDGNVFANDVEEILYYATLAGNSHNTQPWKVKINSENHLLVLADTLRKLHVVDPNSRGLYISLGAFIENLCLSAGAKGYHTEVLYSDDVAHQVAAEIFLEKAKPTDYDLEKIRNRRTLRTPFLTKPIEAAHLEILGIGRECQMFYFDAHTPEGEYISEKTAEAYAQQARDKEAKEELAQWMRFSNRDVKNHRDGLTTSGMGIEGVGGFMVRNFFKPEDSKKSSFVEKGVGNAIEQTQNCGGWIVITQTENSPSCWMKTGRLYQRMNLECRALMIGCHPMNQMIEEKEFESAANTFLGLEGVIQFVARIGYVDAYPEAVSVRRSVDQIVN